MLLYSQKAGNPVDPVVSQLLRLVTVLRYRKRGRGTYDLTVISEKTNLSLGLVEEEQTWVEQHWEHGIRVVDGVPAMHERFNQMSIQGDICQDIMLRLSPGIYHKFDWALSDGSLHS